MDKDQRKRLKRMISKAGMSDLMDVVETLSGDIRDKVIDTASSNITDGKKKQAMGAIKQLVADGDDKVRQWLTRNLAGAYVFGMNTADKFLSQYGIDTPDDLITYDKLRSEAKFKPHTRAVNSLLSDAYTDFGNGLNGVTKSAEKALGLALKEQIRTSIASGRATGKSPQKIAREVRDLLQNRGFTALIDRGGREWALSRYSEMLARTHLIRANTEATLNRAVEYGVDLMEVSTHGADDKLCGPEEGKIYSASGNSQNYPELTTRPPYHPNCFDKETEIYTDKGWQYIKDVDTEDTALSLNPDTLDLEMVEIKNTIEATADKMVSIKNKYMNMLVTPDHDVFYKTDWKHKNDGAFTFVKAEDLVGKKSGTFYASSKWVGEETISEEEAEFMGWYLSEGYVSKVKDSYIIGITQSKEINPEKFAMALEAVEAFTDKNICVDDNSIRFYDKELGKELVRYGKSHEKFVPDNIKQAKPYLIRKFLDAYLLGDGYTHNRNNDYNFESTEKIYSTSSKKMADGIGELIIKVGKRPSYHLAQNKGKEVTHKNGTYTTNHNQWSIRECSHQFLSMQNATSEIVAHNGKVYCVELKKYHTLLTRRNGQVLWNGNCTHTLIPRPELSDND